MEKKETGIHKAHLLVLPYPAQGHINPMLQFCKRLIARGLDTTLSNSVYISKSMHAAADPTTSIKIETISNGFDDGGYAEAESSEAYLAKFRVVGPKTLSDLIDKLPDLGRPVDALVHDAFLPWALVVHTGLDLSLLEED